MTISQLVFWRFYVCTWPIVSSAARERHCCLYEVLLNLHTDISRSSYWDCSTSSTSPSPLNASQAPVLVTATLPCLRILRLVVLASLPRSYSSLGSLGISSLNASWTRLRIK